MDTSDKLHFAALLKGLSVATRGPELTKETLRVYWAVLHTLTIPQLDRAVERAAKECDWFPSVHELLGFSGKPGTRPELRLLPALPRKAPSELGWPDVNGELQSGSKPECDGSPSTAANIIQEWIMRQEGK